MASSQTDSKDILLSVDPDIFPFQHSLTESQVCTVCMYFVLYVYVCMYVCMYVRMYVQVSFPVDGRSWAIAEVPNLAEPISSLHPLPPAIVTQHTQQQRRFVLLTAQVCIYLFDIP